MQNFTYCAPTKVIFGRGIESQIGSTLKDMGVRQLVDDGSGSVRRKSGFWTRLPRISYRGWAFYELWRRCAKPKLSFIREGIALRQAEKINISSLLWAAALSSTLQRRLVLVWNRTNPWQYASTGTHPKTNSRSFPVASC